ncbi:MAG: hypothetical protein M1438_12390, partial [Deltaproteobacteria bacterium]|nr:hypothetical protein [Deltaproteobacteria bacterium]
MDALVEAAIPFFSSRYDEILRKMCEKAPPDPIINMYLVLAGYSGNAGHLFVIWDRPKPPKIEYNRVTEVFTLPRRMGLEFKLNQQIKEKAPLAKLVETAKSWMEKLAGQNDSIAAPFNYVTVSKPGISKV